MILREVEFEKGALYKLGMRRWRGSRRIRKARSQRTGGPATTGERLEH